MSNTNYTSFAHGSQKNAAPKNVEFKPVETPQNGVEEPEVEVEKTVVKGVVTVDLLNVRAKPGRETKILSVIKRGAEVVIDETDADEVFYKVTTATGVEGFCMKDYIDIK